jgi:hypothetical protein
MMREAAQNRVHDVIVARFADVGGAQAQRLGPELIVGETVGADDAKVWKLMMQTLYFIGPGSFQVQYHDFGAVPSDRRSDFLARVGQMDSCKALR